jgi:hypothetical protein
MYLRAAAIILGSHVVRYMAEYMYFTQCAGFWSSIFSWNSPTCKGLRWAADSMMTNVVAIIGGYSVTALQTLTSR